MSQHHPIKEFAEEIEPEVRRCLFCSAIAPADVPTENMIASFGRTWYSNAILDIDTLKIARFYLCPKHCHRKTEALDFARQGQIALN